MFPIDYKFFRITFYSLIILEIFSFGGFLSPFLNKVFFLAVLAGVAFAMRKDLFYGILAILAELVVGSKGYLFFWEFPSGRAISIRIGLFLLVMTVWLVLFIKKSWQTKKIETRFRYSPFFPYYLLFVFFVAWGGINGIGQGHSWSLLFSDINAWFFFFLVFPLYDFYSKSKLPQLSGVFLGALLAMALKTFFLFFVFSHSLTEILPLLYRWTRVTGIAEIVNIKNGFYRVFFQSHIYALLALFFFFPFLNKKFVQNREPIGKNYSFFFFLAALGAVLLLSLSRSFWAGGVVGYLFFLFFSLGRNFRKIGVVFLITFFLFTVSLSLVGGLMYFPIGQSKPDLKNVSLALEERIKSGSNDLAVGSRWNLLPPLLKEIKENWLLGKGFGTTVTYKTKDPRALINNPDGWYTTYAFEWGYLDIWLKIGLLGLLSYLLFLAKIFWFTKRKKENPFFQGGGVALVSLLAVHFFTPYLNHPLGIGAVLFLALIYDKINNN